MIEIWKDIPKYFGKYQASNMGGIKHHEDGELKQYDHPRGYKVVSLSFYGIKSKLVNRLVAKTFIANPENKKQVNHLDGNKTNNFSDNLEWVTLKENVSHAKDTGLLLRKKYNSKISKLAREEVLQIRSVYENGWFTQKELSVAYGITYVAINKIINRKTYKYL